MVRWRQEPVAQPRIVFNAGRRNHDSQRVLGTGKLLTLERLPYRWICKSANVPRGNDKPANMNVIAMGARQLQQGYLTGVVITAR